MRHRINLSPVVRARVERGAQSAVLLEHEPKWAVADELIVARGRRPDDRRDDPLTLTVSSVEATLPSALTVEDARRLGLRTLPELHRELVDADEHMHALSLAARVSRLPTRWLVRWSVSVPHDVRLLPETIGEYVSSLTSPQMQSAGEAVPADYQDVLCALAEDGFNRDARARNAQRLQVERAKRTVAHRQATRRRRIDVVRTENSAVVDLAVYQEQVVQFARHVSDLTVAPLHDPRTGRSRLEFIDNYVRVEPAGPGLIDGPPTGVLA